VVLVFFFLNNSAPSIARSATITITSVQGDAVSPVAGEAAAATIAVLDV